MILCAPFVLHICQKSQISSFHKEHKESRKPESKNNLVLDNYLKILILLFAKMCVVVRCMYCTLPLAAKYRHVILHCICLVKLIEHMLILVQLKWSSAYQIQCPIHLVSIRVLTIVRMRAFFKKFCCSNCCELFSRSRFLCVCFFVFIILIPALQKQSV